MGDQLPDAGNLLAVYGTLRRGCRNHPLVLGRATWLCAASLPGRLLHIGGPRRPYAYPGYLPGADATVVAELVHVADDSLWPVLHELETYVPGNPAASEYVLENVEATLTGGQVVPCVTYVYNRAAASWPLVPDGDWASIEPCR